METNYLRDYYKKETHDLTSLINANSKNEEKIQAIKKEITKLQKSIELKSEELHKEVERVYTSNFIPLSKRVVVRYDGRSNESLFDIATGLEVDNIEEDDIVYTIYNKSDIISVVVGYSYELASIITKKYKYNINRDNTKFNTKLLEERVISFMDGKQARFVAETEQVIEENTSWSELQPLERIKDGEFVNTLYGVNYEGKYDLRELRERNLCNKSFEIILKTSPKEILDDLLKLNLEQAQPIHKIIGVSLETYNKAVERGVIRTLFDNRDYIGGKKNGIYGINKTESEWFETIDEMKHYEEDLQFYNIDYSGGYYYSRNGSLLETLLSSYADEEVFKDNYSFGKFSNYVINETINQGYNRVRDFVSELRDYLRMCKQDDIKPTLYSSYLKQTHDITSRNHNVRVEKENEETFKSRYKDFKEYKGKVYSVVAPKDSNDLKKEGDTLNHCVASYIKRVIDGECLIYFLRKDKEESLITFEVRHNTIVQVRGLHNRKPTENEQQALKEFAKYRKMEVNF